MTEQFFPHYTCPRIAIIRDHDTGMVEVRASIGTAPDDSTVIVYPYLQTECGYWNKTTARERAKAAIRSLKSFVNEHAIKLSEPVRTAEYWS
jgi:hypothetical protein